MQTALDHCSDSERASLLLDAVGEWFREIPAVVSNQATAALILGSEEGSPKERIGRRVKQLTRLVQGESRYGNVQKSAISLKSGEILKPGEEMFSSAFAAAERNMLLEVGSIEVCK